MKSADKGVVRSFKDFRAIAAPDNIRAQENKIIVHSPPSNQTNMIKLYTVGVTIPHTAPSSPAVFGPYRVARTFREGMKMKRRVSMANMWLFSSQEKL